MFKKIFFLLFFLFLFSSANALNSRPVIDSIGYDWYLSDDTIVKIKWKNLDKCNNLSIKWTEILILSWTETEITYYYKSGYFTNWFINLVCWENLGSKEFIFPYIDKIDADADNIKRIYWINWKNFLWGTKVYLESWKQIPYTNSSEVLIIWNVPDNPGSNNIFVKYNNLKSNLYNIDLKAPYIDYIEAKNGFLPWETIILHWKHLDWKTDSYVMVEETKITNYLYNEKENTIEFLLPDLLWNNSIQFYGKWVWSNKIDAFILWNRPKITNWYIKWEYIDNIYTKVLYLVWTWLDTNNDDKYIINRWVKKKITSSDDWLIKVNNYELYSWNNYIFLDINWVYSNIYNVYKKENNPYINYIETGKIDWTKRIIKLWLWNFDKSKDIIYYKWNKIIPISCLSDSCKVSINNVDLTGYFSVAKTNWKKSLNKYFDISDWKYPVIYNIEFESDVKAGTKFKILGTNLDDSNIIIYNMSESEDLDISNTRIEWRFSYSYKPDTKSYIKITKYWKIATLTFTWNDLEKNKYNWHWLIKTIKNSNWSKFIKQWDKIIINWYWFHFDSKVVIWNVEYPVKYNSPTEVLLDIPVDLSEWNYTLKVKNTLWDSSWWFTIKLFPKNYSDVIDIVKLKETSKTLKAIDKYTNEFLYSLKINNFVDDLTITKLSFSIKNYDSSTELWTFKLKLGSIIVWESQISKNWKILFEWFNIDKNTLGNTIYLNKSSPFYSNWNFELHIDSIEAYYRWTNQIIDNIDISNLESFIFNVEDNNIYMCIDSLEDNSNCNNNWISKTNIISNTEQKVVPIKDNKEIIYNKVDKIIDDYISRVSKKSLKSQMDTYKIFKNKIVWIIARNKNSPLKEYLEYFYERINVQFKIVFKEYFDSKK